MSSLAWRHRVLAVQEHVRAHVQEPLDLSALASVAGASRFHFARIFKAETGETLNHFVRRARLERAVKLMQARPERALLDVGLESGFRSASDFSRVFKQHFGVSPSGWDRVSVLRERSLAGYEDGLAAARAACPPLTPVVRDHRALRLAYVRIPTPFMDLAVLDAGYSTLCDWFDRRGLDWRSAPLVGWSWDQPETTPLDQVRFDLGFALPAGVDASGPVREQTFPALSSVDVHVDGPLAWVALAWEELYERWLPTSQREPADLPALKRFRRRPDELGWRTLDVDCCIALT